jgi:hypothetical protein
MAQTPGWFPDPYGRFQQRYHDGQRWTEHVADDGVQQTDPMGASTVVPFAPAAKDLPAEPQANASLDGPRPVLDSSSPDEPPPRRWHRWRRRRLSDGSDAHR